MCNTLSSDFVSPVFEGADGVYGADVLSVALVLLGVEGGSVGICAS